MDSLKRQVDIIYQEQYEQLLDLEPLSFSEPMQLKSWIMKIVGQDEDDQRP